MVSISLCVWCGLILKGYRYSSPQKWSYTKKTQEGFYNVLFLSCLILNKKNRENIVFDDDCNAL